MAPKQGKPFDIPPDNGEYLRPTPVKGNPTNHMAPSEDYMNDHVDPKNHINCVPCGEYLNTAPVEGITPIISHLGRTTERHISKAGNSH